METQVEPCTCLLMLLTGVVSYLGFRSRALEEKYIFQPERILAGKEYYRLVTSAFLHADWQHLGLNLITLYLFGSQVEAFLGAAQFLLIYFGAVLGGSLLSLWVHRHHEYRAYGASGGVCGIIFAYVLLFPGARLYTFPLPFAIPGWLYAIGYLAMSFWGMKTGWGNIGHDAHLGGAIIGLLITAGLEPWAVGRNPGIFVTVLSVAALLLGYLWSNPLFLPLASVFPKETRRKRPPAATRSDKPEQARVDEILEKVARHGVRSLTADEKALLERVSAKLRSRADSEKPKSDLVL